jgi:hypothetical protein
MDDVGPGFIEKRVEAGEGLTHGKPCAELARHQRFAIAGADDLASLDPHYLGGMRIRDFATAN